MPKLRAKDDPLGLAPIRVTEAESKPSAMKSLSAWAEKGLGTITVSSSTKHKL